MNAYRKVQNKKNRKHNEYGAVSVFLVLILVPCLAVTSIFVDIGRVQLAKNVAYSSADLAINTVMTEYDGDLMNHYGLIGSCQDIENYYETAGDYFENGLTSHKAKDEDLTNVIDLYGDLDVVDYFTEDEEVSDYLKITSETDVSNMIQPATKNANLANPAMLRSQIVNFMKFRAPISILENQFMKKIGEQGEEIADEVEKAQEDEKTADKEADYLDEYGDLIASLHKVYNYIADESGTDNLGGEDTDPDSYAKPGIRVTNQDITDISGLYAEGGAYVEVYKGLIDMVYRDFTGTSGVPQDVSGLYPTKSGKYNIDDYVNEGELPSDLKEYKEDTDSAYNVYNAAIEVYNALNAYEAARQNIIAAGIPSTTYETVLKDINNGINEYEMAYYPVQYWTNYIDFSSKLEVYKNTADNLFKKYGYLIVAYNHLTLPTEEGKQLTMKDIDDRYFDENSTEDTLNLVAGNSGEILETYNDLQEFYDEMTGSCKDVFGSGFAANTYSVHTKLEIDKSDSIKMIRDNVDILVNISSNYKWKINSDSRTYKSTTLNEEHTTTEWLAKMNGKLATFKNKCEKAKGYVDKARLELTTTEKKRKAAQTKLDKFETQASKYESDYCTQAKEDVNKTKEVLDLITKENINELSTELTTISNDLQELIDWVNSLKINDTSLMDINSVDQFKTAIGVSDDDDIPQKKDDLELDIEALQGWIQSPGVKGVEKDYPDTELDLTNPDSCELYKVLLNPIATDAKALKAEQEAKSNTAEGQKELKEAENKKDDYDSGRGETQKEAKSEKEDTKPDSKDDKKKLIIYDTTPFDIYDKFKKSGKEFPSGMNTDGFGITDVANSFAKTIKDFKSLSTATGNIRDYLYTMEYVFENFTYQTYEKEEMGKSFLISTSENEDTEKKVKTKAEQKAIFDEKNKERWKNPTDYEILLNKNSRNDLKCPDNNAAYQREIEYIIFGNSNKNNIKDMKTALFSIRYLLNLPAGLVMFSSVTKQPKGNEHVTTSYTIYQSLAYSIEIISQGWIPANLVMVIEALVEVGLETGRDVKYLTNGLPVTVIKKPNVEDGCVWGNSYADENAAKCVDNEFSMTYKDFLYVFLYMELASEPDDTYERIGDVIQVNMRKKLGNGEISSSDYQLKKAITNFKCQTKLKVDPLLLSLPLIYDFVGDPFDNDNWCTFEYCLVRGY